MKHKIAFLIVAACVVGITVSCSGPGSRKSQHGAINLFNGQDLSNWDAYLVEAGVSKDEVWRVEDGIMVCQGTPMGYLYTDNPYTNYKLYVDWRWAPGTEPGNSGVLLSISGPHRALPRSVEAQLKSGSAGDIFGFHGAKVSGDPERMRSVPDHKLGGELTGLTKITTNENPPGEWNSYEIIVEGSRLRLFVNGVLVNEAYDCDLFPGPIGLQSEGGEIHFRKVQLWPN